MSIIGWVFEIVLFILCSFSFYIGMKKKREGNKIEGKKNISASIVGLIFFSVCLYVIFPADQLSNHASEEESEFEIDNGYSISGGDTKDEESTSDYSSEEHEDEALESYEVEDTIYSFVNENFAFDVTLDDFELNTHMGTNKKDEYIALVYLNMPKAISVKKGYDWIDKYTNYLAAKLGEVHENIAELVIFWKMSGSEKNVAKYVLQRSGKNFIFESKWQDSNVID